MRFLRLCLLFIASFIIKNTFASHYKAGEITYRLIAPLTYEVTVVTYTNIGPSALADDDSVIVDWGDGISQSVLRSNGPIINGLRNGVPIGNETKLNKYTTTHTYSGARNFFIISTLNRDRIAGVCNINNGNSDNIAFYIEDTLFFTDAASYGLNNGPILLNPPIDYANVNDTFIHNPNAWDIDGDSLVYALVPSKKSQNFQVDNYIFPDQDIPGANNKISINPQTGQIIWATPKRCNCIYNIAILITEYRKGKKLSTILRDMQIVTKCENNDPPQISAISDTCIRAGDTLITQIISNEPNLGQVDTLIAQGGPMLLTNSPARFTPSVAIGSPATATFTWETICEHIRKAAYQVLFKSTDNYRNPSNLTPLPLTDIHPLSIKVIPPPPDTLSGNITGNSIVLNWTNPYNCASFNQFVGFSVWRRQGSNPFIPSYCETGLDGKGYTKIKDSLLTYTYTDNDVSHGQKYCYRILAHFKKLSPNGFVVLDESVSVPSNEICFELKRDVPVIINADVRKTDVLNGSVLVRWTNPLLKDFDTILNPAPYKYEVFSDNVLKQTYTANSFSNLVDTTYIDTPLNTVISEHIYTIKFYANNILKGSTNKASTVFITPNPSDKTITLSWNEKVPWNNFEYNIFRQNFGTGTFNFVGLTNTKNYIDTGLVNDSLYCYYVLSKGTYNTTGFIVPFLNNSQIVCSRPKDTIPPCTPTLTVQNDCGKFLQNAWDTSSYTNTLTWTVSDTVCAKDIKKVHIYFAEDTGVSYILLDSVLGNIQKYLHTRTNQIAGCYYITALDNAGNESKPSDTICVDNCPYYDLPNTFTPNGDNQNDYFVPFKPYRFVKRIDIKIYTRWGNEVFRTTDPEIRWDGKDQSTGKEVEEGTYYYSGYYIEDRLGKEVEKPFPASKRGGGFIHLFRGK